ncbi:uncharacterized protein At5g41620-like isoform X2 [Olea europaea var. sylvestris]|uniref:uncharacterized protein At5g41620-like isoform X1 n=1 Tax=Olea europaea var. sylvestris TaxID=158386 RepID=UPI000C1D16E7|nr:uncharacterized protein At5g41620-like isoform X1 [Olea europaea var. sylvestris]XP_022881300.1 uncharacterized protein At5g41620-like isoform X2 [Olea europaea var. sylvestris]
MKRGEKSVQRPAEKEESLGEKLRKLSKRGGHTTPVVPYWRLKQLEYQLHIQADSPHNGGAAAQDSTFENTPFTLPCVSSRKLAATLWELQHYKLPLSKMHQGVSVLPPHLRRLHHQNKGSLEPPDPSPGSPDLPGSASSLKRQVAASLVQHHRSIERSHRAIQPVSPASYCSSLEITPYNPTATPTSSIDLKGRIGETSQRLKTSTELLKVLNRIWVLEEQHVSNISLVKALKRDLDHARSRIKELVREQQTERLEIDDLMKQIKEDTLIRKNKEQDRINAAILSLREELENERKLRKRSESLHRQLARELFEVKTTLTSTSKELEKERKSSKLLEDLCDEFAWGIRDYEQELHAVRQKYDKDGAERADHDRLILHVSESWLDERLQMKLESESALGAKKSVVQKLSSEIEAFLRARSGNKTNRNLDQRDPTIRRNSLESIPLNVAVSAPRDEDDSAGSDSNCFELAKPSASNLKSLENEYEENHYDETMKVKPAKKKVGSSERTKGLSPSSLQVKFEEQMARALSNQVEDTKLTNTKQGNAVEISFLQKSEKCEAAEGNSSRRKNKYEGETELNSNYMIDNLIRNHYLLSESGNMQRDNDTAQASIWRSRASPVRQWTAKLSSHDHDISESSSKLPPDSKENTLKAKLLEARTRGQRSRSRLKASIIPSRVE